MHTIHPERVRQLNSESITTSGPVIYWMSRDQRLEDNWAVLYAQNLAMELKRELEIVFVLAPNFLDATLRQYDFMLRGLEEVSSACQSKNISFRLIIGDCTEEIPTICKQLDAAALVTDFSPLKIKKLWMDTILENLRIPVYEIDAHNIVPCWEASDKQEYAAYTIRPKIHKKLSEYLVPFSDVQRHPYGDAISTFLSTEQYINQISVDTTVQPVSNYSTGAIAALKVLNDFVNRIHSYDEDHNDPNKNAQSNLSPYLHFGQLSAQRVVLRINQSVQSSESKEAFLEELIVRRELSDNYCYYNNNYDTFEGFPDWAKKTLNEHRSDPREFVYPQEEFEQAKTHDPLWNAAQLEMITTGKMHGYMRMYWAKKILEWTNSPEEAQSIAIYLNDKYELDGRDPNGYTGIAWSIGGVHDRAWPEHNVYGKIRYMNYTGAKRKFDTEAYISKFSDLI